MSKFSVHVSCTSHGHAGSVHLTDTMVVRPHVLESTGWITVHAPNSDDHMTFVASSAEAYELLAQGCLDMAAQMRQADAERTYDVGIVGGAA